MMDTKLPATIWLQDALISFDIFSWGGGKEGSDDLRKQIDPDWWHNPSHDGQRANLMHWDINVKVKEQNEVYF